jgi:hypothetical protein
MKDLDVCILRMPKVSDGQPMGSIIPPLKLKLAPSNESVPSWVGTVGNIQGLGLKASSDKGVMKSRDGMLFHCAPTSSLSSGGNSGAPLYDSEGNIIGIDSLTIALNSGCKLRNKTTGVAVASDAILTQLGSTGSTEALAHELLTGHR